MDYKMRTETHFSQPKKVRNTKCLDPLLLISPPAFFQTLPAISWLAVVLLHVARQ